jgi:hypothetical protein
MPAEILTAAVPMRANAAAELPDLIDQLLP